MGAELVGSPHRREAFSDIDGLFAGKLRSHKLGGAFKNAFRPEWAVQINWLRLANSASATTDFRLSLSIKRVL